MIENINEIIYRLKENGCRNDIIEILCQLSMKGDETSLILLLKKYRQELQDFIDSECRLIDYLDCLIFKIEHKD